MCLLESLIKMYFLRIRFREQMNLSRSLGADSLGGADLLIPDSPERAGGWERVRRGSGWWLGAQKGKVLQRLVWGGSPGCG